tara:strand:+ start:1941 stop:2543 length:603 start_codon:yes stop_codon:yes gene_type:complete
MLKKEFNKKDVNRMRNLITGKTGASSGIQIGYKKQIKDYKEGDVWTEGKKTWTIKNGIKQTISKLDAIKKEVFMPLCCPKCGNVMKKRLDKPNYKIHKKCFDCVIEFEGKLRNKPGAYEQYLKELEIKNKLTLLDKAESYLLEAVNTSNEGYISEKGELERWVGGIDSEKYSKEIKKHSKRVRKNLEKELNESTKSKRIN